MTIDADDDDDRDDNGDNNRDGDGRWVSSGGRGY